MQITRLRVSGFKSFSDPVDLLIETGLTGVVGPNGCGKSNIVEALRWAMGESSARGLRGDEMEDVIFNGSLGRPAHDVAEVRLKLKGRPNGLAGFESIEDVEIARKLARGVGSSYRINGREARARDVQLLFADAAVGARSPAIVGQGQIGFIVDAKPAERRKLLEDAAGIGGLQTRRREAELKLDATRANLQRLMDLLGAQEARLNELRQQSRQAERYRKLAAELRRVETLLVLARYAAAAEAAANGREAERTAAGLHAERVEAASALRDQRDGIASRLPDRREQAARHGTRAVQLAERLASLREAAGREAAHLAGLERQQAEAVADLARAESTARELEIRIAALAGRLEEAADRRARLGLSSTEAEEVERAAAARLSSAQDSVRAAVGRAAEAKARLAAAEQRLGGMRARQAAIEHELARLPADQVARNERAHAETAAAAAAQTLQEARRSLAAAEVELQEVEPRRESQRGAVAEAEKALAAARADLAEAEPRLREIRAARARLEERGKELERRAGRLAERRGAHAARTEAHARSLAELGVEARGRELAVAETELREADAVLDAAREVLAGIEHARTEALGQARELRRAKDAVEAEIRVLATLVTEGEAGGLLDALTVPAELAAALGAAMGDDLLAGTDPAAGRFWREPGENVAEEAAWPFLPAPARPLLAMIKAPPVLWRRLSQTGLVDAAIAPRLQPMLLPGQRLVSEEGGLWRWDGFVRASGVEDGVGAGIRHRLRLQAARAEAAVLGEELAEAERTVADHDAALAAARRALGEAETRWRAADTAQLRARHRHEQALAAATRLAAEAEHLGVEAAALEQDASELAGERTALELTAAEMPDEAARAQAVAEARQAVERAETNLRETQAILARLEAAHAAAAREVREARAALDRAQAAAESRRAEAERAARHAAEAEAARRTKEAALTAEAATLAAAAREAEHQLAAIRAEATAAQEAHTAAEAEFREADSAYRAAAGSLATCRAEGTHVARQEEELRRRRQEAGSQLEQATQAVGELRARCERLEADLAEARARNHRDPAELDRLADEAAAAETARAVTQAELTEAEQELAEVERRLQAAEAAGMEARERLILAYNERQHAEAAHEEMTRAAFDRLQHDPATLLAEAETQAALVATSREELETRLVKLRAARDRLGPVNLRAEVEIGELEASIGETQAHRAELEAAIDRLGKAIATLNKEGRERLMAVFAAVDDHFRRLFTRLFGGGRAQLRLAGSDDPLQAGLELEASPPGKKLTSISLLSGGEKTLTALALVFAFFLAQPSPLCVLDEVDAPLDDANVDRFVSLMQEIARETGTRFLVVTHHPLTMARMDRLYGVTMAERGVSRLVSVALEEALELRATA